MLAWGSNSYGQLGVGDTQERSSPVVVAELWAMPVQQLAAGMNNSCVVACLHHTNCPSTSPPMLKATLHAVIFRKCCERHAGSRHSAALTSNGFLFTWGANDCGQLGLPSSAVAAAHAQTLRTTSEKIRVRRGVNQRFLSAMVEMGIPRDKAELALAETGNVGVEVCNVGLRCTCSFEL